MLQIAFSSTMIEPLDDTELSQLVEQSRTYNHSVGISGSMVVGGNRFASMLEGEEQEISALFGRICRDPRHHAIVLLGRRMTDHRLFADHPLGLERLAPIGPSMSLAQMAKYLGEQNSHEVLYSRLHRYASVLAAA